MVGVSPSLSSVHALTEAILLDTTGAGSWLGVLVSASGAQAEALREELSRDGIEVMSTKRLRLCAQRFSRARRVGPMQCRDDRAANEFFISEIFEIADFLTPGPSADWLKLELTNAFIDEFLSGDTGSLPPQGEFVHTIELHSIALAPAELQRRGVDTDYLRFLRLRKMQTGHWTMKWTLSVLADSVPFAAMEDHDRTVQEIRAQSTWSILLPIGAPRPRHVKDFGALPLRKTAPVAPVPAPAAVPGAVSGRNGDYGNGPPMRPVLPSVAASFRRKRKRRRNSHSHGRRIEPKPKKRWPIMAGCLSALVLILIVVVVARNAERIPLFHAKPPPPVTPVNPLLTQ